jgi:dodecin
VRPDNVYKSVEITGTAATVDEAIRGAIAKAAQTLRHIDWFEVLTIRGHVRESDVGHVQVTLKIGFRLE